MRIFFLLLILIATGCKDSVKEKTIDFKTNLLEIKLLETTPVNPRYTQLIASDSGEYLLLLNDFKDKFQFLEHPFTQSQLRNLEMFPMRCTQTNMQMKSGCYGLSILT